MDAIEQCMLVWTREALITFKITLKLPQNSLEIDSLESQNLEILRHQCMLFADMEVIFPEYLQKHLASIVMTSFWGR